MADGQAVHREKPPALVIRLLGVKRLGAACDLTSNAIHKWGDVVPSKHQPAVLALARDLGIDLTADEIIHGRQITPREAEPEARP